MVLLLALGRGRNHAPSTITAASASSIGSHGRVWSEDGHLIASGGAQFLSIPNPRPPTPPASSQKQTG